MNVCRIIIEEIEKLKKLLCTFECKECER